jgi:uncharacterized protein (DUF1697 family)
LVEEVASMKKYIAFMRSINVTGRFVKMEDLRTAFKAAGHPNATTLMTSGNVIFRAQTPPEPAEVTALECRLSELLGFETELFVRAPSEIEAVIKFAESRVEENISGGVIQVAFIAAPLSQVQLSALTHLQSQADKLVSQGSEVYWHKKEEGLPSRFSGTAMERALSVRATFRRLSMLKKLVTSLRQIDQQAGD